MSNVRKELVRLNQVINLTVGTTNAGMGVAPASSPIRRADMVGSLPQEWFIRFVEPTEYANEQGHVIPCLHLG